MTHEHLKEGQAVLQIDIESVGILITQERADQLLIKGKCVIFLAELLLLSLLLLRESFAR